MTAPQMFRNTAIFITLGVFFLTLASSGFFSACGAASLALGGCFLVGGVIRWMHDNEPKKGAGG